MSLQCSFDANGWRHLVSAAVQLFFIASSS